MKYLIALALCLLLSFPVRAAAPVLAIRTPATEQSIEQGRQSLLALRFSDADRQFRATAARPDGVLAATYHLGLSAMVRALASDRREDYDAFLARVDTLEGLVKRQPAGLWTDYVRAELALQKTIVLGMTDRNVAAAMAARSAYGQFSRLVKQHPDCYEAYGGMGLLHLAIGSLPRGYRRVLSLLGIHGSVETGLSEIRTAATRSTYGQEQGQLALALTDVLLFGEPERGVAPLRTLAKSHPNSPLIAYLEGVVLLKARRAVQAEALLHRAVAAGGLRFSEFYLGKVLFMEGRYAEAEREYRRFLARPGSASLRSAGLVGLGMSIEMQGRRDEGLRYYRQVRTGRDLDGDAAAAREAAERIAEPLQGAERTLLLGRMAYDAGRYTDAVRLLTPLIDSSAVEPERRAEAAYRLGRVYHAQNDSALALSRYARAVAVSKDPNARWAPWSQFYAGTIHAERHDTTRARQAFRAALAYKGNYDYHQALEQGAKAWLERLN